MTWSPEQSSSACVWCGGLLLTVAVSFTQTFIPFGLPGIVSVAAVSGSAGLVSPGATGLKLARALSDWSGVDRAVSIHGLAGTCAV